MPTSFTYTDDRLIISETLKAIDNKLTLDTSYTLVLQLSVKQIQTVGPSGAVNNYAEVYEIDKNGKELGKFKVTKFQAVVQDTRQRHFIWWTPHLSLGLMAGYNGDKLLGANLDFSVMGYGLTNNDLSFRFLEVGAFLSDKVGFLFAPLAWNFGRDLPLLSNLWVSPNFLYTGSKPGVGLSLGVML